MYIGRYHPSLAVYFRVLALGSISTLLEMVWKIYVHQNSVLSIRNLVLSEKSSLQTGTYDYRWTYTKNNSTIGRHIHSIGRHPSCIIEAYRFYSMYCLLRLTHRQHVTFTGQHMTLYRSTHAWNRSAHEFHRSTYATKISKTSHFFKIFCIPFASKPVCI